MAKRLVYEGSLDGSGQILKAILVNDTQTIYKGDVIVLSGGKASIGADAAAAGTVLGVAAHDIVTTTATVADILLYDANDKSIYRAPLTGTGTPTIGTKYDMGTACYVVDLDDTAGGYFQIVGEFDGSAYNSDDDTALVILRNRVFGMA